MFYKVFRAIVLFFLRPVFCFKIYGKENMPEGKCLVIGNHFAILDVAHLAQLTKEQLHFIAKQEIYENKFLAWLCNKLGAFPVDRDGADAGAVLHGMRILKAGRKLAIFPEGTRNKTNDEVQEIKGGAGVFAVKTKSAIVPCIQLKKARAFRRNYIMVGEPFELSEYYGVKLTDDNIREMGEKIRDRMTELHGKLQEEVAARKKRKKKAKN